MGSKFDENTITNKGSESSLSYTPPEYSQSIPYRYESSFSSSSSVVSVTEYLRVSQRLL
jgi:hypothetical protein